jgi:electron transfer flavoprotein alpha subunit
MRELWILAEAKLGKVAPVSFELLAWARSLGGPQDIRVTALLPGSASDPEELCYRGADRVLHADDPRLDGVKAAAFASLARKLFSRGRPDVFLAAATSSGRTLLPYLAAKEGLGLTADCTELSLDLESGSLYQTRPAAGGNIMATILTPRTRPQSATVRPHSRAALERDPGRPVRVERVDADRVLARDPRVVEERPFPASRGLADARVVVAGGRGLRTKAGFAPLEKLAERLGAEVGASREAVDRGWIDYPHQVGLSGRTIAPEVYMAFGISGAIQHLAGMQTSKTIISVDSDPDAPIFAVSNLAIRGDLFELLPRLIEALGEGGIKGQEER